MQDRVMIFISNFTYILQVSCKYLEGTYWFFKRSLHGSVQNLMWS